MSKPIYEIVDDLPTKNMTISALKSLDFVVPGEWENLVGFENTIRGITGEEDEEVIQEIGDRAVYLFNDRSQGYQRALWIYQTIDSTGTALGAAALANKVGEKIPLLGFLNSLTPKADKAQTIDLSIKVVGELIGFCQINGLPGDSIGDFVAALGDYGGASIMRMAALVCFDGLIPLGPDFIMGVQSTLERLTPNELEDSGSFKGIQDAIPGDDSQSKLSFIGESFESVKGWMSDFVTDRGVTPEQIANNLQSFIEFSDDKLDYLAAFLDMSTNYYEHTGIQSLARSLIERAAAEI
ncbi:MAG: hypothetical protein F6J94_09755 [Moorea sp. SIO1F2]|uniref:hypothetical protein n=1 Tax=unclassified Moorena TaxID=2683338 RepID=UPI0013BA248C|nr:MULTISPECIES: hypothetical protein [unclassified Moorena]NEN95110.1 hypothetical protein [Moorena sp. SIO3I7]NEO08875.1 hypothetical protein [Moorena sp. SIO3I8]NEO21385.1 hypothetical protein [Moorena sp. SIO4A5]NEP25003.1 hypothetical protein [Moorena sp. SIO3I6]NEQ60387.1 hypothetical protein [Moorena sp. SIO4A1]